MEKDWNIIIGEYVKSQQLINKNLDGLIWYLSKQDWHQFVDWMEKYTGYEIDRNGVVTFMGVEVRMYKTN